jgi:hypothetical protein
MARQFDEAPVPVKSPLPADGRIGAREGNLGCVIGAKVCNSWLVNRTVTVAARTDERRRPPITMVL